MNRSHLSDTTAAQQPGPRILGSVLSVLSDHTGCAYTITACIQITIYRTQSIATVCARDAAGATTSFTTIQHLNNMGFRAAATQVARVM